ncbi:MAG: serine hydrolase [Myxococcales bacterium]|nr:serine hydrolase [Myxococcales bacterium]
MRLHNTSLFAALVACACGGTQLPPAASMTSQPDGKLAPRPDIEPPVSTTPPAPQPVLAEASPESVGMSSERLQRIGEVVDRYVDQRLIPGAITLVARRGKIVHFEAHGFMDAEAQRPMQKDTLFRIASMTKPITSVALMMLWEEGKLQLDDPVSKFLPEFDDQKVSTTSDASGKTGKLVPVTRKATVRDLLTHTAGLANNYVGNVEAYKEVADVRPDDTLETLIKRLAALPLNYQPGAQWQYSAATDVVGRLVEVLSGQNLDEFMRQRIFEPLDMPDTHFFLADTKGQRLAAQYTPDPQGKIQLQDPGSEDSRWIKGPKRVFRGAGGLVSTTRDYLRFQQMMLDGGQLDGVRLLAPSTVSLMFENHTGDLPLWLPGPGYGFGLGYAVITDRGAAATPSSQGTVGWGGAYCTRFWIDREAELIGILMTQVRPYTHLNVREDFRTAVYQAILE